MIGMRCAWLVVAGLSCVVLSVGCKTSGVFNCADDSQCAGQGEVGTCEPLGFCSFADGDCPSGQRYGEFSGELSGVCVDEPNATDAGLPDAVTSCTPGERICTGNRTLGTCGSSGNGIDPSLDVLCEFVCQVDECVAAGNLPPAFADGCDSTAPPLAPASGTTVQVVNDDGPRIDCDPDCGDGTTEEIVSMDIGNNMAAFCVSALDIPDGIEVTVAAAIDQSLVILVDGTAVIAGTIDVSGVDGDSTTAGRGGPGGGSGGLHSDAEGQPGGGACAGSGGGRVGLPNNFGAGGGGGGGYGGTGGAGGDGRSPNNSNIGPGGAGGGLCPGAELITLAGGSGGASGGDGTCSGDCGWPGGGGGGAIQIASRASISISGSLIASGGAGEGFANGNPSAGGGGGGGSGGAILLEAPAISIRGNLLVDGGAGGAAGGGAGGAGATGAEINGGPGADHDAAGDGGSGGGGGGGRVRVNGPDVVCANVSPVDSCSTGTLTP